MQNKLNLLFDHGKKLHRPTLLLALVAMLTAGASKIAQAADVVIETNRGVIEVVLDAERAPLTVANFLAYVAADGYRDVLFHRVIPGFMVQTGGYRGDLTLLSESDELRNEADNGLTNQRGTLAMARMDAIDSATRQFFINVADNPHLDHQQAELHAATGRRASGSSRAGTPKAENLRELWIRGLWSGRRWNGGR